VSWVDKLEEQGKKSVREKRKHEPRFPVQEVIVSFAIPVRTIPARSRSATSSCRAIPTLTDEHGRPLEGDYYREARWRPKAHCRTSDAGTVGGVTRGRLQSAARLSQDGVGVIYAAS
jgi:hypothetical protein